MNFQGRAARVGSFLLTLASYNAGGNLSTNRRLSDIGTEIRADLLGIQSTQCAQRAATETVLLSQDNHFLSIQWPYNPRGKWVNRSCGLALILNDRLFHFRDIRNIFIPPVDLQGRIAAIHLAKPKLYNFFVFVLYLPTRNSCYSSPLVTAKIFDWMTQVIDKGPRCFYCCFG